MGPKKINAQAAASHRAHLGASIGEGHPGRSRESPRLTWGSPDGSERRCPTLTRQNGEGKYLVDVVRVLPPGLETLPKLPPSYAWHCDDDLHVIYKQNSIER